MSRPLAKLCAGLLFAAALGAATLPRPAGQIEFVSHTGAQIKLSDLKGKVVVIEFLLTNCPTCKASARLLSRLRNEYGPQGVEIVGLAIDPGAGPKLIQFVRETGANFPIGLLEEIAAREFLQVPSVIRMMMPQIAIIDRRGYIREQHGAQEPWMAEANEEKNFRAVFEKLLAENPLGPKGTPKTVPPKK